MVFDRLALYYVYDLPGLRFIYLQTFCNVYSNDT